MNDSKVLILNPNGYINEYFDRDNNRENGLKKYLENEELTFPGYKKFNRDFLSLYLAGLNYIVIHFDHTDYDNNRENYFYIGNKVTKEQRKWLKRNINLFNDTYKKVKTINSDPFPSSSINQIHYYELGYDNKKILKKIINGKVVNTNKSKVNKRKCYGV